MGNLWAEALAKAHGQWTIRTRRRLVCRGLLPVACCRLPAVIAVALFGYATLCVPATAQEEPPQPGDEETAVTEVGPQAEGPQADPGATAASDAAAPDDATPGVQDPSAGDHPSAGIQPEVEGAEAGADEEPAATPQELAATGEAAAKTDAWPAELADDEIQIEADNVYYYAGATGAQGNVVVKYRDLVIRADVAEIDEDQVWGQFRGNVTIEMANQRTTATRLRVNFDTEEWQVEGGRTTLQPDFFERGVAEPVFVGGERTEAEEGGEPVHVTDGYATSCDLEQPHYALTSPRITVVPEHHVVLRKPTLEAFGHRVIRWPWDLVLSLRRRHNRFIPTVGKNEVEGYYAKFAYLYLAGSHADGIVRLHLTQRRGVGFGGDHYFDASRQSGEMSVFFEPGEGAYSGRGRHLYRFTDELGSNLSLSMQRNSGYGGATTSLSGNLSLRHSGDSSDSTLGFEHSRTDSAYSQSRRFTTNFSHRQRLGFDAGWNLQSVLRQSSYGSSQADRESLESDFEYHQRRTHVDWAFAAEKQWDLSDDAADSYGSRYGLDRLPEIVVNTDSRRLDDWEIFGRVPLRATLRAGRFVQYPDEETISMAALETNLGGGTTRLGNSSALRTSGTFTQAFYDEGSARYSTGWAASLDNDLSSGWESRLSYGFGSVHGYSPLRRDYGYRRHDVNVQLVRQVWDRSHMELTSGYDFVDDRYREARLRAYFNTSARTRWELMGGYAIEESTWRPVQLRWIHARPDKLYLTASSRYDVDRSELTSADAELEWQAHRFWRLQAISTYSGYTDDFEHLNLRLTRDLHCWIASLTYNKDLREVRLNFGIKAFPFEEREWGLGRTGARLGSYQQPYY